MDIEEKREEGYRFCRKHLVECCEEILEWHETTFLRKGKVCQLARLFSFAEPYEKQMAENTIAKFAMEVVAQLKVEEDTAVNSLVFITQEEIIKMLPVVVSDLKHEHDRADRKITNKNIRRSLYQYVIREMFSKGRFNFSEVKEDRKHLFIKGYVRDVWKYLDDAYQLIHKFNFVEYLNIESKNTSNTQCDNLRKEEEK